MEKEIATEVFLAMRLRLHHIACRILRDEDDADDAVQDAFCRLWDSPEVDDPGVVRRRLVVVLRNLCIDRLRRRKTYSENSPDETAGICQPSLHFDADATSRRLMGELPPMQREVFRLVAIEDYEYNEVAERLGISEEAVRANMSRARKRLRDVYRKYEL